MPSSLTANDTSIHLLLPPEGIPALDNTYGAIVLGCVFGFMLYGLMLHQTYRYYRLYPGDRLALKILIFIIVALETFHTILWIIICYEYLVVNYFNPLNLLRTHWYIKLTIPMTAIAGAANQIFYSGRLYYLGPQYRLVVVATVFLMLLYLGWDFAATVKVFNSASLNDFSRWTWIISVTYGFILLCDLITASALILVLRRNRTGVKQTDTVVDALAMYTVNTGLLTTVIGTLSFIFALVYPDTLIYAGLSIPGVKLYSNSVLAMLNSRHSLSKRMMQNCEADSQDPGRTHPPSSHNVLETWHVREVPPAITLQETIVTTRSLSTSSDAAEVTSGESSGNDLEKAQRGPIGTAPA